MAFGEDSAAEVDKPVSGPWDVDGATVEVGELATNSLSGLEDVLGRHAL